jgi:Tfp pilus assembly protein PilO
MVIGAVALLAAFWFLALGPKRKDEKSLNDKIALAQQRLDSARQQTAAADAARKRYDEDYATVAKLGKAVPADDDVASLVYQLDHISTGTHVDFRSIKLQSSGSSAASVAPPAAQAAAVASASGTTPPASGSSSSSTPAPSSSSTTPPAPSTGVPATQSAAAGLPPGSTVGSAGFPTMPFSFDFDGSFFDMEHFFEDVQGFASTSGDNVSVHGRLLTVDAFALTASRFGFPRVKASINATAYLVPQDEGLTGGATPQGPGATPASSTGSSGSPTAPAAATSIAGGAR